MRDMLAEHRLHSSDLIWPLFVCAGEDCEQPIGSLPGVSRWSVDRLAGQARLAAELGREPIGCSQSSPSHTNSGQMRSLECSRCSASISRIHGLERPRRMRRAG
jgi:porphobilinogen synthase